MLRAMQFLATAFTAMLIAIFIQDHHQKNLCNASPDKIYEAVGISVRHWSNLIKKSENLDHSSIIKEIVRSDDFKNPDSRNRRAEISVDMEPKRWRIDYWRVLPKETAHLITDIDGCGRIGELTTFILRNDKEESKQ